MSDTPTTLDEWVEAQRLADQSRAAKRKVSRAANGKVTTDTPTSDPAPAGLTDDDIATTLEAWIAAKRLYAQGRAAKRKVVTDMRTAGLTYRTIAEYLGISSTYSRELIKDPDAEKRKSRTRLAADRLAADRNFAARLASEGIAADA